MAKTYKDDLAGAIHETASGIYAANLMPKTAMRKIDELCLTPVAEFVPEEIKAIRGKATAGRTKNAK